MFQDLQSLKQFLNYNKFRVEPQNCNGKIVLTRTALYDAEIFTPEVKKLLKERKQLYKKFKGKFKGSSSKISPGINTTNQSINIGIRLYRNATSLAVSPLKDIECSGLYFLKYQFNVKLKIYKNNLNFEMKCNKKLEFIEK